MTAGAVPMWTVEVAVPQRAVPAVEAAIAPFCTAVASFEALDRGRDAWLVTGYAVDEPDPADLAGRVALVGTAEGCELAEPVVARLPDTDWLAANRRSFKPVRAGHYHVIPADMEQEPAPVGPRDIVLHLNAGPAFGSGTHETTRGCLIALDRLTRFRPPRRLLDLGAGSGILAIAAAKTWPSSWIVATDIDPVAVRTAQQNAADNGVAGRITARTGPGFRPVARMGRFDLIVANIQARPLMRLAAAMRRHATPGATVVLSGLLARHAPRVQGEYAAQGFTTAERIRIGDWTTLVLHFRSGPA